MNRLAKTFFFLLLTASLPASELTGKVVKVADGDTLTIESADGQKHKIRLAGIDAPESKQHFGQQAQRALAGKVLDQTVRITWEKEDQYSRKIGKIFLGERWINLELVTGGFAWHYKDYSKDQQLADAEAAAKAGGKGLWGDGDATAPWDWRKADKDSQGIRETLRGHRPGTDTKGPIESGKIEILSDNPEHQPSGPPDDPFTQLPDPNQSFDPSQGVDMDSEDPFGQEPDPDQSFDPVQGMDMGSEDPFNEEPNPNQSFDPAQGMDMESEDPFNEAPDPNQSFDPSQGMDMGSEDPFGQEPVESHPAGPPATGSTYPPHWGAPPAIQTRDLRPLPGGYGRGSSTLAAWIQKNLDADARKKERK